MSLGMFMHMCHNFGMISNNIRVPSDLNNLEKKRRGIPIPTQIEKKKTSKRGTVIKKRRAFGEKRG